MGAVESVLREVEKVTIRPVGDVARCVERVAIRPVGGIARELEKVTIRPIGEIARELEKVTIRPIGGIARELEKVTIRPLGEIASDLERLLRKPLGGIASRTLLLTERVKEVVEQDASINSNIDRQARRETLNGIVVDAVQLQGDINEAILATPPAEEDSLQFLGGFQKANDNILGGVEVMQNNEDYIQKQKELMQNNAELTQDRQELMEDVSALIQDNKYLASENQNLRGRLDHLEALFRGFIIEKNNSDQLD